jgi:hypothetical protein
VASIPRSVKIGDLLEILAEIGGTQVQQAFLLHEEGNVATKQTRSPSEFEFE